MKIVVLGKTIETREIYNIQDVEQGKSCFLNREAGFIIFLIDKSPLVFKQDIPYYSYASEISAIKQKWFELQTEVFEKWQLDKCDIPTFYLK